MGNASATKPPGPWITLALAAAWPVLSFAGHNIARQPSLTRLLLYFCGSAALTVLLYAIFLQLQRRKYPERALCTSVVGVIGFYCYVVTKSAVTMIWPGFSTAALGTGLVISLVAWLVIWLSLVAASFRISTWLEGRFVGAAATLCLYGAMALNVVPVAQIVSGMWGAGAEPKTIQRDMATPSLIPILPPSDAPKHRANVYHLIMDGLAGARAQQAIFNHDVTPFFSNMRHRGLWVSGKGYSNYSSTVFTISSMMQMSYVLKEGEATFDNIRVRELGDMSRGHNAVYEAFRRRGYSVHQFDNAYSSFTRCDGHEDHCLSGDEFLSQMEIGFFDMTPLLDLMAVAGNNGLQRFFLEKTIREVDDLLLQLPAVDAGPFYLFAHVILPHPPLRFAADCAPLYNSYHGLYYGSEKEFLQQFECAEKQSLRLIDAIIDRDPGAIILMHGDHGTFFLGQHIDTPLADVTEAQFEEMYNITTAARLPGDCQGWLYDEISPVNFMRVILACLDGKRPTLLEDKSFLANHLAGQPDFGDVIRWRGKSDASSSPASDTIRQPATEP
jgi:hypothetical protein